MTISRDYYVVSYHSILSIFGGNSHEKIHSFSMSNKEPIHLDKANMNGSLI